MEVLRSHASHRRYSFTGYGPLGKLLPLGISAAVFVLFGLFVLWCGRDRASLWLGLYCASFGATLFSHYENLPHEAAQLTWLLKSVLWFGSFYALYAMAETVVGDVVAEDDRSHKVIGWLRAGVISTLAVGLLINVYQLVLSDSEYGGGGIPAVFADILAAVLDIAWVGIFCMAPLALLTIAWLRAADATKREKARVILLTTVAGLSGPILSISIELARHQIPHFQTTWFTLLAIPLGFVVTIPAYRVVEVKVVVNKLLVLTTMTLILGAVIASTEMVADRFLRASMHHEQLGVAANAAGQRGKPIARASAAAPPDAATTLGNGTRLDSILELIVAFLIVVSFSHLHHFLDEAFKRIVFRRRDDAIERLHAFASGPAGVISQREPLLAQAAAVVCEVLGACTAAFYEERRRQFHLAHTGDGAWPKLVDENDPVLIALRAGPRVNLAEVRPSNSVIGNAGLAFRMAVGGRMIGALVIGPRANDASAGYDAEEVEALVELARGVSEALFNLRAQETVEFVRAVRDGRLHGADAVRGAELIWRNGFAGINDSPLLEASSEAVSLPALKT